MDDIFREAKKDYLKEELLRIWQSQGKFIILVFVLFIAVFIAFLAYKQSEKASYEKQSELLNKYFIALEQNDQQAAFDLASEINNINQDSIYSILTALEGNGNLENSNNIEASDKLKIYHDMLLINQLLANNEVDISEITLIKNQFMVINFLQAVEKGDYLVAQELANEIMLNPEIDDNFKKVTREFLHYLRNI